MGVNKKRWETKKRVRKIEKIAEKKLCEIKKKNHKNFVFFFELFQENVLKTLLRGRETTIVDEA